ncbi:MAG: LptF/LptG family permease [Oligoflexales bacterium]|nr:LptF/LptG family permease [Oligoflexales bacterium]
MILPLYILKEYFRFIFSTLVLCLFLFTLFDFIYRITGYFAHYRPSYSLILQYYLYQIPFEVFQLLPIAVLLASVAVMVLLNRSGEIVAMRAAGLSPLGLASPLATGGLLATLFAFFLGECVIPYSSKKMRYVSWVLIEGDNEMNLNIESQWLKGEKDSFISFRSYSPETKKITGLKLLYVNPDFKPLKSVHATTAQYVEKDTGPIWELEGVKTLIFSQETGLKTTSSQAELSMSLPIDPTKLMIDRRMPDEMTFNELSQLIDAGIRGGSDVAKFRIAWHTKWGYPFACFLLSLIGLSFGYRFERTTETVRRILFAVALGISYWFILSSCRALASSGDLPIFAAGWFPNLWLVIVICYQMIKLRKA